MSQIYGAGRPKLIDAALVVQAAEHAEEIEPDLVPILDMLRRVELRTNAYHRELVGTRPVDDPHLAAFLQRWAAEEMEHGRALSSVVEARGYASAEQQLTADAQISQSQHRRTIRVNRVVSEIVPTPFLAIHMTVGLMNEWTAHFIYRCLADMTDSESLRNLLMALSRQESHHAGEYRKRAVGALDRSRAARAGVRAYLRSTWSPVGEDVLGVDGHSQIYGLLAEHPKWQHYLELCDERIARLPGLDRTTPYADAQGAFLGAS